MSDEIQRFWSEQASNVRCVRESDYDALSDRHLDLLGDVLDAKEFMRASGVGQDDFASMFKRFVEKRAQPAGVAVPEGWLYRLNPESPNADWQFTQCPDVAARLERSVNVEVVRLDAAPHPVSVERFPVKRYERDEVAGHSDVEVAVPGLIHYDHGPNLAEALARLAYRVAKFHKLDAPTLCAPHPVSGEQKCVSEDVLAECGLGYPLSKEKAVELWHSGIRSEPITVLEAWQAIGHDAGCNPSKDELIASLRNMAAICYAHGCDMPAAQDVAGDVLVEWIEHGPSRPCPFTHPYSSKVDIRLRDGTEKLGELACNVTWFWYAHEHHDYHVVAYRPAAHRAQQAKP